MPVISVITCTHNPRPDYLQRALDALKAQTMPKEQWELLLIDNASKEPLAPGWDLSWHPQGRHVREDELGLTPARLRGLNESTGEFIVFVDDDNVLAPDYLEEVASLFHLWPKLGAIGASIKGEFEVPPPDWITPYFEWLVVYELPRDYWSNFNGWSRATPYGAGLSVRREVANDYVQKVMKSPLRRMLDRSGTSLLMGGDLDLAWCATDMGLGTGRFRSLRMTHLISKGRMTESYLVRSQAGCAASYKILEAIRDHDLAIPSSSLKKRIRFLINYWRSKGVARKVLVASAKAEGEARKIIATHQSAGGEKV